MITLTRDEFQNKYGATSQPVTLSKEDFNRRYEKKGFFKELGEDIKQTGASLKRTFGKTQEKIQGITDAELAGEQGKGRSFLQAGGAIAGGLSQGFGDVVIGAIKSVLPQVAEEKVKTGVVKGIQAVAPIAKKVDESLGRPVGTFINDYNKLPEKEKRDVDSLMGITTLAADLAGSALFKKGTQVGVKTGITQGLKTTEAISAKASQVSQRASKLVGATKEKVGEVAYNKLIKTSRDIIKMSPTQTRNEVKWLKNTPKFLVDEGVVGLIDSDGKRVVTGEAVFALRNKYNAEARAFNRLLTDSGEYISLDKFRKQAVDEIGDTFKNRGTDYKKAIKNIDNEVKAYKENFRADGLIDGDDLLVNISDFNRIKSGLWSKTSNFNPSVADKLLSDVNYKMGQTARGMIEDTVEDVAVKRMNSRLGDFASSLNILEKADGKVLPGGLIGKAFTRVAATVIGSGAGLPGAIAGNITGGILADIMMNPKIKTGILRKLMKTVKNKKNGQSIIDEAEDILFKRGEERAKRKLLQESSTITTAPPKDASKLFTQEEADLLLKEMGTIREKERLLLTEGITKTPEITSPTIKLGKEAQSTIDAREIKRLSKPSKVVDGEIVKGADNLIEEAKKYNFERASGLSQVDKDIEAMAFSKIIEQEDTILSDVIKQRGKIVNTDDYRLPFKDVGYNGSNAAAVQEPASYLSKKAFTRGLKNPEEFATFYAGGSGTGKTSAINNLKELESILNDSATVLDSNLSSYNSAIKKIKEAEKAGKTPIIMYAYREPVDSFVNGVVKRMINNPAESGRIVPSKVTAGNHIDSWDVVKRLNKDGYEVLLIDNSLGIKKQKLASFGELDKKIKYPSKEKLTDIFNKEAEKLYDNGKGTITKEQYEAYIK